jgi:exosome complex component RRP42
MNKTFNITKQRVKKYLEEGKRFDSRNPEEFREITIEYEVSNKAEGSTRVKIGKTEVIVGVKMDVGTPYPDSKDKGNLITSAEVLPLSSPRTELGKPGFDSLEIGRVIDRGLRESGFIDFKGLCIKEGEKVWNLYVDIYTINDDGNLLDAAGIGAIAALKKSAIPKYDEENERVIYDESSGKKVPLSEVVPITISVYKVGNKFLVDPTREEEDSSTTRIIAGSDKGIIYSMQKSNEEAVTTEEFTEALSLLEKSWEKVSKKIEKQLK